MGFFDSLTAPFTAAETIAALDETQAAAISEHLEGAEMTIEHLQESIADLELMLEDRGWQRLGMWADQQFSRQGTVQAAQLCRAMAVANPLIRRGLNLRIGYIWGGGVQIQARATGGDDGTQDVNGLVVQPFLDDRGVRRELFGAQARERNERTLGTDGNLFCALFTARRKGTVQPRMIPLEEIVDIIKNPEDRTETWFYKRISSDAAGRQTTTYHPDVDYQPAARVIFRQNQPQTLSIGNQQMEPGEVLWDAPIAMMKVNALADWDYGIGDAFAAIAWARAYKEFLESWAKLMKSLARFAWRVTATKGTAAAKAKDRIASRSRTREGGDADGVGQTAAMTGANLEAIPKSGATLDAESGKPLAGMIAAGLDVPVTMLLSDPGVTGARATAETLDTPTENMAGLRREAISEYYRRILDYVIQASVLASDGALKGVASRDEWGRLVLDLEGDTETTIEITWPDLTETSIDVLMSALNTADAMDYLPPLTMVKLILNALQKHIDDPDEILDEVTDDKGEFIPPSRTLGQAAVDAARAGRDPAGTVR